MISTTSSQVLVEAIAASAEDAVILEAAGVGRIELCAAIVMGGLTPSLGTLEAVNKATRLPIVAMVRPRGSGFCYTDGEFAAMEHDVGNFAKSSAQGVVFGILTEEGKIDQERCRRLVELAYPKDAICHRSFDATPDPFEALETLIELGFRRVLTSGHATTALEGTNTISALIERAAGRIEILPGSGIRPGNAKAIVERTGVNQIHIGPFHEVPDPSLQGRKTVVEYGLSYPKADQLTISGVVAAVAREE